MQLWPLLALAFLVQEPISSGVLLLQAYQNHYNVWLIHLLFTCTTIIDIFLGYALGLWIEKKFGTRKMIVSLKKHLDALSHFIGRWGKAAGLIVFAPLIFPISAIFMPWLDVTLPEALIYLLVGEWFFWYAYEWLLVLGTKAWISNSQWAFLGILILSLMTSVGIKVMAKKASKTGTKEVSKSD